MKARFKGGPILLNSGGRGPDDYLLKPIKWGRWTLVIFRFGRNFQQRAGGLGSRQAQDDQRAMEYIFPIQEICVPDNWERYTRMLRKLREGKGGLPQMGAAEFWAKYKDYPLARVSLW